MIVEDEPMDTLVNGWTESTQYEVGTPGEAFDVYYTFA